MDHLAALLTQAFLGSVIFYNCNGRKQILQYPNHLAAFPQQLITFPIFYESVKRQNNDIIY